MRRRLPIALAVLIVVAAAVVLVLIFARPSPRPDRLEASGTIEADEVEIAPKVGGRVVRLAVDEGDPVRAGQVVARLDTAELRDQQTQAAGAYASALARLRDLEAGTRPEQIQAARAALAQAQAAVAGARAALATARESYRKSTALAGQVEQAQANLASARAALAQARARRDLVFAGTRPEVIQQAEAAVASAQAAASRTEADYERAEDLFAQGALSAQQRDAARQARDSAAAALRSAQAALEEARHGPRPQERQAAQEAVRQAQAGLASAQSALATAREAYADRLDARARVESAETQLGVAHEQERAARANLNLALAGPTPEQIKAARGQVKQARGALSLAGVQLGNATVRSPLTGVVLTRVVERGEVVAAGQPLLTAASLNPVKLRIYVPENQYGRVKLRQHARVTVDSYPGTRFSARVTRIAEQPEFTPRNIQTKQERVKLVYGVELTVANPQGRLKPGMPADAVVFLGSGK